MRRALLEVGRRLTAAGGLYGAEDVFFLTKTELWHAALTGMDAEAAERLRAGAALRKAMWRERRELAPPDRVPPIGSSTWQRRGLAFWRAPRRRGLSQACVGGLPASPGRATGTARLLRSEAEFARVQNGDIIVATAATGAWAPLFALASALVLDAGGVTSHVAMLALELGIPAVVATGTATTRIRDGQTITVDGTAGLVYV
jgi:pyruvate,water dikinase